MSWWLIAPWLNRQVELGNMTKEEADERLKNIIEADLRQDELYKEILKINKE